MYSLQARALSHSFSHAQPILKNVNISVPTGSIYGFLGPNGAGKTTTLKLILGLTKKQQGEILVFGQSLEGNRKKILQQIGSMIETPSLYAQLTARENLRVLQYIYQCPKERIEEVLRITRLQDTGSKKAGAFSLGMKQRLSIAAALLHSPSLLVLDEPTNGLDPNGMIEIRDLLKYLNEQLGITIIISSHLLGEIEKIVTHVGVIHKGEMLFEGTLSELTGKQQQTSHFILHTSSIDTTQQVLQQFDLHGKRDGEKIALPLPDKNTIAQINQQLVNAGVSVYEMSTVRNDLEQIFMNLINQPAS